MDYSDQHNEDFLSVINSDFQKKSFRGHFLIKKFSAGQGQISLRNPRTFLFALPGLNAG